MKTLFELETSGEHLSFDTFWWASTWTYNKNKLCNISGY